MDGKFQDIKVENAESQLMWISRKVEIIHIYFLENSVKVKYKFNDIVFTMEFPKKGRILKIE